MKINIIKKSQLLFILSFLLLIAMGTVLLQTIMLLGKNGISFIDALFISTSAVCVTGLTTVPTSQFNIGGQLILLLLMQLGGLGIMTLTSFFIIMVRREMNLDNKLLISGVIETFSGRELNGLLRVVVMYSLIIEAIGALLLTAGFHYEMHMPLMQAAYYGFFHSISAFCNAGFSLYDDSLVHCGAFVKIVSGVLIICGGLGFYVIFDIRQVIKKKSFMKIHTKLVLITSAVLIISGMLALKFIERAGDSPMSWLDALFQSVTSRTGGFNTVNMNMLEPASLLVLIALMLIGASPGSTGGGIKTTTIALVFIALYKTFIGERHVTMFKRKIATTNVLKAFCIMLLFIILLVGATIGISFFEDRTLSEMMFEVASALGTVGLSLGLTAEATIPTKIILILCMFLGRIGPFTFFLFLLSREKTSKLEYPEERLIMG
ncbi:MAG: hypothetical protein JXR78_18920 [Victivallales bacterium]|nr:hypothetical protein [Victivallales bacterium]